MTDTKMRLLKVFSDGADHTCWHFGAGTISWAKKNGFIELVPGCTVRVYRITDAGRAALAGAK